MPISPSYWWVFLLLIVVAAGVSIWIGLRWPPKDRA
jgi:hypothetical protein